MEPQAVVTPAPAASPQPAPVAAPETQESAAPERTFTQKELDDILEKRLAKERRKREEIRTERDVLRKLALEREPPKPAEPAKAPAGEPVREQFQSYEDFIEARAVYRAEQKIEAKFKERDTQDRERAAKSEQQRAGEDFKKRLKESAKDITDYDEVISGIGPNDPVGKLHPMPFETVEAPGKVLYYLAKNPEEAERIASLPVGQQAREIWKLEQTLSAAKPPVKPSKAPEPITPVGGKAAVGDEMPDPAKNPDKWMKWREAQIAARKRQGVRA